VAVYLDNNATTPVHREVVDAMSACLREQWANASSLHEPGRLARQAIEQARGDLAALLACAPEELVFTAGGTEADNLAIMGAARASRSRGNHVITTAIEHHAVLDCVAALERLGFRITCLPVDGSGLVDPESVLTALEPETVLVSVMHANNETGAIQPVEEIGNLLRDRNVLFHTDAVQAAGKLHLDVNRLGVDLLSVSAHKMHGPKGVGALYVKQGVEIENIMYGGGQEDSRRPGTYNVTGIVGMGTAARLATRSIDEDAGYVSALAGRLESAIRRMAPDAEVLIDPACRLPNTLNVCFPGDESMAIITNLDLLGVAVSAGSACTSGSPEPSHVLRAMGVDESLAKGSVRFSLGSSNSEADIEEAARALKKVLARRRAQDPDPCADGCDCCGE